MIHGPTIYGKGAIARKPRAMPGSLIRSEPAVAQFVRCAVTTACLNMAFKAVVMSAGVLAV
jgi:hypothetical protein